MSAGTDTAELVLPDTPGEMRSLLNHLRGGVECRPGEKPTKIPRLLVQAMIVEAIEDYLDRGGEFFRCPEPYYFDRRGKQLIRMDPKESRWKQYLKQLGLLASQLDTTLVAENVQIIAEDSPERKRHRFAYMTPDSSAAYFYSGRESMVKVTEDAIALVSVGTDGVFLMADDLVEWPPLDEVRPLMESLRPLIGRACTRPVAGSPMTEHLTARWSNSGVLSSVQQQWLWLQRVLFLTCANRYSMWPLTLILGEQNSGKSTAPERMLAALLGEPTDLKGLPERADSLVASLTNRALAVYDNIDGFADDHGRKGFSNTFCLVATRGEIDLRKLYTTNTLVSVRVQNHVWFTSRTQPFERDDLLRRVLRLETSADGVQDGDKDALIEEAALARPAILAEWALRAQNMLRAHRSWSGVKYSPITRMGSYEKYARIMAEYEGTTAETEALWEAYMKSYFESISESNPLVVALRYWLGSSKDNAGRWVDPESLMIQVKTCYGKLGLELPYKNVNAFGSSLRKYETPLKTLGFEKRRTSNGIEYRFQLGEAEVHHYRRLYIAALKSHGEGFDRSSAHYQAKIEAEKLEREMQGLSVTNDGFFSAEDVSDMDMEIGLVPRKRACA